jgi:hypothetical protein
MTKFEFEQAKCLMAGTAKVDITPKGKSIEAILL